MAITASKSKFDPYANSAEDPALTTAPNVLPLPQRYRAGQYPTWANQLGSWQATVQPIKPEEAREGRDNSIVSICLHWVCTSWQVAIPQVGSKSGKDFNPLLGTTHPFLVALLDSDVGDSYADLCWRMIGDYLCKGISYAYKLKNNLGQVIGFEHLPARWVKPIPHPDTGRLWYYAYSPWGGTMAGVYKIAPLDIVCWKHGAQLDYPLLGVSPFAAQYRQIVVDNAYGDFQAGVAKTGFPPVVFSPRLVKTEDGETTVDLDAETAREISDDMNEKFANEPGRARIINAALEMHKVGVNPDEMAITDSLAGPETRIPAAIGLPSALLQLYTGLAKSTMNNLNQSIKQGWRGCMLPYMALFAATFTAQCLRVDWPDAKLKRLVIEFDTSAVKELADDNTNIRNTARADYQAGLLTEEEARAEGGRETDAGTLSRLQESKKPEQAPSGANDQGRNNPSKSLGLQFKNLQSGTGDIYSVANAFRRALLRNEQDALDALQSAYGGTYKRIDDHISTLISEVEQIQSEGDKVPESATHVKNRMHDLLIQIGQEMGKLSERGADVISSGQREFIATSVDGAEPLARAAAGAAPAGVSLDWNALPASSFEQLVGMAGDGSPLADVLSRAGKDYAKAIRDELLNGLAMGKNPREVAAQMATIANVSKSRMETIARSEMLRAGREATRKTYKANADIVDGYVRLAAEDMRTCAACWALSGTEYETSDIMPSHAQCRCVQIPRTKSWAEITGDDSLPDTRPTILDGATRFAGLSDAQQEEILGPGLYQQYKDGADLSSFAQVYDDPLWGPSVRTKPVGATS
jgi:SPP1 gp7 family putative phage head morphogenesis protein